MKTRKKKTSKRAQATAGLLLNPELTIRTAADEKARLSSLLAGDGAVRLDPTQITRIDTAGLQLLCAFVQHLRTNGRTLNWEGTSPVLTEAAATLGLAHELQP